MRPCHFSGSGLRLFESILKSDARTVISPVFVLNSLPFTPMMSPRSRNFLNQSLYIPSGRASRAK